ncbi:GerAB/ArcD/ProY family transporter [Paenibacillus mucilaginosus]|uniref:Spore germination protein n=1 Tax=Paenibacillus mucilaginosus (strain KNP414) TaxID=1036673 RepID=F8F6R3_PAEMK|nr:endospore germination permease [Paenibacillus mucilaginosus]AEI43579.1 spore germination protein [Paenibacillus mucilaginosus KNP414]MCG7211886.1 spore germination protein [Paenibacillus mucilaginosus]WDM25113.1 endospore germination permease [Paenibacillus mucilaginosus]
MIKRSDGKIGIREYTSLILITVGLKLADTTPSLLMDKGKNAGWILPLLSFVLMAVSFLILLSVLRRHEGKGLMELIRQLAGTYGGFVLGMLLVLFTLGSTVLNTRSYSDILNTMVYQKTPLSALYVMLMLAAFYVSNRGFEAIGRTAWIVIPYIEVFLFLLVGFVWRDIDWLHLGPIAGPGWIDLIKESTMHTSVYGEMVLLTALLPLVRSFEDFRKASYWGFSFCALKIAAMTAIYVAVFDYPAAKNMAYPFQQLTRTAAIGQIITHIESVFLAFWLIASVIHFAVYIYLLAFLVARTLRMEEFEPLLLPLTGLILLLGLLPENISKVNQYRELFLQGSTVLYLLLPFVLWSLDRWRRRVPQ